MLHIIKIFSISFLLVFLLHQFWNYIKNTYSVKKTKDPVSFQTQKYQSIIQEILSTHSTPDPNASVPSNNELTLYNHSSDEFLSPQEMSSMENELLSIVHGNIHENGSSMM